MATPKAEVPDVVGAITGVLPTASQRIKAAKAEFAAYQAWEKAGRKGDAPATPNLDVLRDDADYRKRNGGRRRRSANPRKTATVTYYRYGVQVQESMNKLSTLAWFFTKNITSPGRLGANGLRKVLADLGVTEPETTTWRVVLPNGEDIGATAPGDTLPTLSATDAKRAVDPATRRKSAAAPAPAKAAAKKQPTKPAAKKAAAAKSAPAKKPAAKRAPAKRATSTRTKVSQAAGSKK